MRAQIGFVRAGALALGAWSARTEKSPLKVVQTPNDLDKLPVTTLTMNEFQGVMNYLPEIGIKPYTLTTYKRACREGWAPPPTNDIQKAIWEQVRTDKELWGYVQDENLSIAELLQEKNQGIRPAVGYPSLPDQSIIFTFDRLLHVDEIGITLTPNGAMTPHASVCGMMIAHPQARYFAVGKISGEQLADYAQRRGTEAVELQKFLSKSIE